VRLFPRPHPSCAKLRKKIKIKAAEVMQGFPETVSDHWQMRVVAAEGGRGATGRRWRGILLVYGVVEALEMAWMW